MTWLSARLMSSENALKSALAQIFTHWVYWNLSKPFWKSVVDLFKEMWTYFTPQLSNLGRRHLQLDSESLLTLWMSALQLHGLHIIMWVRTAQQCPRLWRDKERGEPPALQEVILWERGVFSGPWPKYMLMHLCKHLWRPFYHFSSRFGHLIFGTPM